MIGQHPNTGVSTLGRFVTASDRSPYMLAPRPAPASPRIMLVSSMMPFAARYSGALRPTATAPSPPPTQAPASPLRHLDSSKAAAPAPLAPDTKVRAPAAPPSARTAAPPVPTAMTPSTMPVATGCCSAKWTPDSTTSETQLLEENGLMLQRPAG